VTRGCALALLPLCGLLGSCSLILDFSNKAIPIDAPTDTPYSHAECAYMEPNDSYAAAMKITSADTGPAAICALNPGVPDVDYYSFTVPAGTSKVTFQTMFTNALGDLDMKLYDSTQAVVSENLGVTDGETIECPGNSPPCTTLAAGTYVVEVFGSAPSVMNRYTFQLSMQ
jgi:hypothetical protein